MTTTTTAPGPALDVNEAYGAMLVAARRGSWFAAGSYARSIRRWAVSRGAACPKLLVPRLAVVVVVERRACRELGLPVPTADQVATETAPYLARKETADPVNFLPGIEAEPQEGWHEACPKCGAPARARLRPDTVHHAELRCTANPSHFAWLPKPKPATATEPDHGPEADMAKISEEFASKYLSAADLNEFKGRKTVLTIESASIETFKNDDGQKTKKVVLTFRDHDKSMVVNATNRDTIVGLYGDDTDDWEGQPIGLHVEKVQFGSKRVDAIRVDDEKPRPSKKEKPPARPAKPTRDAGDDEGEEDDDEPNF